MTTEERLETLEKELARAKKHSRWLLAGAVIVLVGAVLCGKALGPNEAMAQPAAGAVKKELRANAFLLVDQKGKVRAALDTYEDGSAGLALFDEQCKNRATLSTYEDGSVRLALYDEQGKNRATLSTDEEKSGLTLFNQQGLPRASLEEIRDFVWLNLNNKQGNSCTQAMVTEGGGAFVIYDGQGLDGKTIWRAP
jgi:hypothetical protein